MLAEDKRAQLLGIVQQMDGAGASPDEVRLVVEKFKSQFDSPAAPARQLPLSSKGAMATSLAGLDVPKPEEYQREAKILPAVGTMLGAMAGPPGWAAIALGSGIGGMAGKAAQTLATVGDAPPESGAQVAGKIAREGLTDAALGGAFAAAPGVVRGLTQKVASAVGPKAGNILKFALDPRTLGTVAAAEEMKRTGNPIDAAVAGLGVRYGLKGSKFGRLGEKVEGALARAAEGSVVSQAEKTAIGEAVAEKVAQQAPQAAEAALPKLAQKIKSNPLPRSYAGKAEALDKLKWPADVIKGLEADEIKAIIRAGETYPPGKGFLAAGVGEKANGRTAFGYSSRSPNERFARNNTPDARVATDSDDMMSLLQQSIDAAMKRKK